MQDMAGILVNELDEPLAASFHRIFFSSIGDRLASGSDEILLNIISERVLRLPPEIRVDKDVPFNEIPRGGST